jgi:branched-chain amino acid transport system substrate-binding protein
LFDSFTQETLMKLKTLAAALAVGLGTCSAIAQTNTGPVRIGFITDMSSLYADIDGPAGAEMIK